MANSTDEMRQYREAFSLFDKDHDDIIAPQELGNSNSYIIEKIYFLFFKYIN
jgi:Ca2+-binding EF-hand superfamily protein